MSQRRLRATLPEGGRVTEEALLKEPNVKAAIDKLTERGARREELLQLILSIPRASGQAEPLVAGITERKLRELPDRINELSEQIKKITESPFLTPSPEHLTRLATPESAETTSSCFLAIPSLLRLYAEHLRVSLDYFHPKEGSSKVMPREYFRMQRLLTLRLLRVVRDATGKPHYSEVSTLLEAAYRASGKPKIIDAENLKKQEKNAPPGLRTIVHFLPNSLVSPA